MTGGNPYESPKEVEASYPSVALPVTLFMVGLPFVMAGNIGLVAFVFWLVLGDYDSSVVLLLFGLGAFCSLVVGLAIWRLAKKISPMEC